MFSSRFVYIITTKEGICVKMDQKVTTGQTKVEGVSHPNQFRTKHTIACMFPAGWLTFILTTHHHPLKQIIMFPYVTIWLSATMLVRKPYLRRLHEYTAAHHADCKY